MMQDQNNCDYICLHLHLQHAWGGQSYILHGPLSKAGSPEASSKQDVPWIMQLLNQVAAPRRRANGLIPIKGNCCCNARYPACQGDC